MEFRSVGRSGLQVSLAGLGCNNFGGRIDEDATAAWSTPRSTRGSRSSIRPTSTAARSSEEFLGRALGSRRDDVIVATKFGDADGRGAVHGRRLAPYVDARRRGEPAPARHRLHRPLPDALRPTRPLRSKRRLPRSTDLVHDGKVRYLGSSNFAGWQIADADWTARTRGFARFVSAQNEWSLLRRGVGARGRTRVRTVRREPASRTSRSRAARSPASTTGASPHRPAPGTRETAATRWLTDANFARIEALDQFATEHGHTVGELALAWLSSQPVVCSVIAGATRPEQVTENVAAVEWRLSRERSPFDRRACSRRCAEGW